MDDYDRKFAEMQKYIPFLEAMIERLKKVENKSRASQLQKMQSLHGILSNSKRKLKIETLQRCEEVLQKLHNKVEKGNATTSNLQSNKNTEDTKPNITGHLEPKIECTTDDESIKDTVMKHKRVFVKKMEDDETPASPSPPASPDQISEPKTVKPIIIPTERSDGFTGMMVDDRPASPDACEMIETIAVREPIIIPTEREDVKTIMNPLRNVDPDSHRIIPRWSYPDGVPNRVAQISNLWSSDASSNSGETRPRTLRHIPTVPAPSKSSGGLLRKPVLILEKKTSNTENESAAASTFDPPSGASEPRLRSPDGDSHTPRTMKTSPKIKDFPAVPKLSTTSLLVSPPPVLTMPPLTIEDLAELLQDEGDKNDEKKSDTSSKQDDPKRAMSERDSEEAKKADKESDGKTTGASSSSGNKDGKSSTNFAFTHMDIDHETERHWEEIDKPIVKLQSHQSVRRIFTSPSGTPAKSTDISKASTSSQSVSSQSSCSASVGTERPTDSRNFSSSQAKDRDSGQSSEVRYADNYEKHPRQSRDNHKRLDSTSSAFACNNEVESVANNDDRALYQRRTYSGNATVHTEADPRSNVEFYKNIVQRERERAREEREAKEREAQRQRALHIQRERERDLQREREHEREIEREMTQSANRGMIHHSPGRGVEPCNQGQWGQNMNYQAGPQGPNIYPTQQRPDMWMQGGPNNLQMEPHMMGDQGHMRSSQYPGPQNSCGRPMLSPQDMNMGPCMDMNMGACMDRNMGPCMDMNMGPCMDMNMGPRMDTGFRDDMPNSNMGPQSMGPQQHPSVMPGMMQPPGYPMGPQYHQFPQENRQNVQQFDRSQDFPHPRQSWDQAGNRSNDNIQYPRSQGPTGPPQGQWNRPNRGGGGGGGPLPVPQPLMTPPLISQQGPPGQGNRNFNDRGRNSDSSRNPPFNRDPRDQRDSRDPRMRSDAPTNSQNSNPPAAPTPVNSRREHPRFSKENPQAPSAANKPKEPSTSNDRNQRRRNRDSKDTSKHATSKEKELEREKARKRDEKNRRDYKNEKKRDKEIENKVVNEKLAKDVMLSPLESLYGVIDTAAKTGKGYGLQKFKIPKIRRSEPVPSPSPKVIGDIIEENWDLPDESSESLIAIETDSDIMEIARVDNKTETDDKKSEVTSTTGETSDEPQISKEIVDIADDTMTKETAVESTDMEKVTSKLPESEPTVDTSTKNTEDINPSVKETEGPKFKEEVTQEMIETLIRKSFDKEFFEKTKIMQKLGEALQATRKFKKIQKIIDSEDESSSDKDEKIESKKIGSKKKRRVIVSDSSDEECLAHRLGQIDTSENDKTEIANSRVEETNNETKGSEKISTKENIDENLGQDNATNKILEISDDTSRDKQELPNKKGKPFRRKKRERKAKSVTTTKEQSTTVADSETNVETNEQNDEEKTEVSPKEPVKTRPKRRNSLEMLQEDIREMFISQGVVTATGHRMCRLIKEAQDTSTTTLDSTTNKGSTSSLDRQGGKNESDLEDETQRPQSVNSRGRGGRTKGRKRARCRVKPRKSVKEIPSSDSETEDSIRTEISAQNENNEGTKILEETTRNEAVDNSKSSKDDSEGSHFLRRSERVGLRESMKEPRVHDKSEHGKMESSKTMFDSSSDESFGIDVSELTAAVDISLHPESRGRITSSPVGKGSSNRKSSVSRKKRSGKGKQSIGKVEKPDNVASTDEIESIASDLSRASSLTRGKKANSVGMKQDTNEEMLSDLLTGLVDSKNSGNNPENDNDVVPIAGGVKSTGRKKKKKKASWALGIVKKKKKKMSSPVSTPTNEIEGSIVNTAQLDTSFEETKETTIGESSLNLEPKEEILSDGSVPKSSGDPVGDTTTKPLVVHKEEPCSPVKNSSANKSAVNPDDTVDNKKPLEELLMDETSGVDDDSTIEAEYKNFGIKKLTSYVWTSKKDRFQCLYCPWSGKNIVHHYTLSHGEREMMISRLSMSDSKRAMTEALTGNYEKRIPKAVTKDVRTFQCRFCAFKTVGSSSTAVEAFYEHCTTHTGEYRFSCNGCSYRTVARSSMKTHYYRRTCNNKDHGNIQIAIREDSVPDDFLYGYMCTKCNFLQLKESNVRKHVKLHHENLPDADIVKIDMSSHVDDDLYDSIDTTETKAELKQENDSLAEMNVDIPETTEFNVSATTASNVTGPIADDTDNIDIVDESLKNEDLKNEVIADPAKSADEQSVVETPTGSQEITAGNLSAFVCPPELENKEDEIQLERQKKMQEIVKNIGILNNLSEKRDLSIIDKLKDKMTENLNENLEDGETEEFETRDERSEVVSSEEVPATNLPILLIESVTSLAPGDELAEKVSELPAEPIKDEPEEVIGRTSEMAKDDDVTDTEDKSEKRVKDPLTNLDEEHKDDSSDDDESDNDNVTEKPPSYESDTSTEQSDSEIPADVNSLLEETFNINATSNAPMMTTIQRLAAKLQGENPFASGTVVNQNAEKSDDNEQQQQTSDGIIPKKPNAIPISSIQKFLGRRNAMLQEVAKEVGEVVTEVNESNVVTPPLSASNSRPSSPSPISSAKSSLPVSSPPKKFIRLRRLSGDKLSIPGPIETPAEITPLEIVEASNIDDGATSANNEVLHNDAEEECSFLRIENVVSLAPGADNNPNETMIDEMRKAVASTSIKGSPGSVSLLKKPNPNIAKRAMTGLPLTNAPANNLPIRPVATMPMTNLPIRPLATLSTTNIPARPATALPTTNIPIRPVPTPTLNIPIRPAPTMPTTSIPIKPAPTMPTANVPIKPAPTMPITNSPLRPPPALPVANVPIRPATIPGLPVPAIPVPPQLKQNFKIVKVVRGLTLLKQKDSTHRVFGVKSKTPDTFAAMLHSVKLRHFYKCMSRNCSYTTDCQQSFGLHYRHHKDNVDRSKGVMTTYDFQRCPYCSETLTTWNAMSEHLKDKHIYCQYQCNYCFYRGIAQSYVELHQMTVHQGFAASVLLGHRESPPIEVIDRREFVIPFVCHHECGKSFYVPGAFLAHLRTKHGNSLSIFKCHLCPAPSFKAEQLVAHYKLHGIYKYQCLYCLFGSEQSADVHAHLSASHYNRPPHILERTLQPRPVRDKDVIQQLIVLNVDEGYKCSELTLAPGQDSADVPKNKHWLQVDRNTTSDGSPAVGEVTLPIGNIGMNRLFSYEKLGDSIEASTISAPASPASVSPAPVITKLRKISPKKSSENILIVDDGGTLRKIAKRKDVVGEISTMSSSSTVSVAESSSSSNTSDSLRSTIVRTSLSPEPTTNKLLCNEEFVNFNILDNPEFLKIVDNINATKTCGKIVEPTKDDDDDSDIEILEDIDVSSKKSIVNKKSDLTILEPVEEATVTKEEQSQLIPVKEAVETSKAIEISNDNQPVIVCSSNENSSDINVEANPIAVEVPETFDRPLTLNDIRDTGFTGVQLYRCGYDGCEYGAETSALLRTHIKECFYASEMKNLNCVHCSKRFVKIGFLVEHFKLHGLRRFGCSMCKNRWPMPYQAMSHMKTKHKQTYTKLIPADPKNPSADGLFVVEPIPTNGTSRTKKRGRVKSLEKEIYKIGEVEKISFGPMDIESLPRQAIYQREVRCAVCPYTTKVRTNIIRHLQLHAKDETVPESGPVNPVPCLDKKERMFDKMVNLASSSHQNGRMGGKIVKEPTIDSDAEFLPKFIPEHKRYVCGVTECNYLTCDESMLRYHLKALHPDEPYFRCPHCPAPVPGHEIQNVAIDKMAVHLKMHDTRLYKCSHCNNHHYHRHVVERHLSDKHSEMNPYVKVIREPESTESVQPPASQDETDDGTADPDGNHWKCNVCEYKCVYKTEMVTHAVNAHEEKGQFKCNACSYKTNNKISFDQHVNAKHPYDLNADCTLIYQKIKGVGLKKPTNDSVETGTLDEPFDTTPLWRRDMPRVRHIRGILFEDENSTKPESPAKSNKRKSDADGAAKPAKLKSAKSTPADASVLDRENDSPWNGNVSSENSLSEPTVDLAESYLETEPGSASYTTVDMAKLVRKFGPLGSPIAVFYRCTICQSFKTKYRHDMRDHLYRDLKYWRYRCTTCGYMGVNKTASLKHFMKNHYPRRPTDEEQTTLPVNHELETWVQALLKSQTNEMRGLSNGPNINALQDIKLKKTNTTNVRRSFDETKHKIETNIAQSPLKDSSLKAKTVDLTQTISAMQNESMAVDSESATDDVIVDEDDDNSRDFDALVIDNKEDCWDDEDCSNDTTNLDNSETSVTSKGPLICKHCNLKISNVRGFKLHVEVRHLRRNPFLCRHCDTSLNSEKLIQRHLRISHPDLPAAIIRNPVKNPPELTDDFWETEYGVTATRKRKRNDDLLTVDPFDKTPGVFHICHKCGFRAINHFGLTVHMRRHTTTKDYKCAYCTYASATKSELWQHSELNHSNLDWKAKNFDLMINETSESDTKDELSSNERVAENYQDYVEGPSGAGCSSSIIINKADMMYSCFYCNSGKTTLEGVKDHWKMVHKSTTKMPGDGAAQRTGLPFRYKEIPASATKKGLRCGYCPKRGTAAQIRLHSRKKHASKPVKFVEIPLNPLSWVCHWCKEICDTDAKKKIHHNLFHSHLTPNFKRQEVAANETPGHECPECVFRTTSRTTMEKHLEKHVDSVICKRCDKTFPDVSIGILHNTQAHPGEVSKIEGFKTNVEKMMARVVWRNDVSQDKNTFETVGRSALENSWKHCGVARKSTTKSSILLHPAPTDIKSVARKSTNPLPRYPPGIRFATSEDGDGTENIKSEQSISYYGKPIVPVNLTNINTYITLGGGRQMKLTCTALAQLIDIEPCIMIKDLKHDFKGFTNPVDKM